MKIGVYGQVLKEKQLKGIGYYLHHLLLALSRLDQDNLYQIISNAPLAQELPYAKNLRGSVFSRGIKKGFVFLGFPKAIKKEDCDLVFFPKELISFRLSVPVVITAFDLFFFKLPQALKKEVSWDTKIHFALAKRAFAKASKILAISEDTKRDLIDLCGVSPDRIAVTPLGCDPAFFQRAPQEEVDRLFQRCGICSPYFINTSSVWWGRKNLLRLIQAFSNFKKKHRTAHQFIITGLPGPSTGAMKELISKEGLSQDVLLLNYMPRKDLISLLQNAEALVFPSLHEGFGLPVIEAMAAGCPVVTSQNSALSEVSGDAALLVDPYSIDSIENGLEQVVSDPLLRQSLVAKGNSRSSLFTWEQTAKKTLAEFNALS